MAEAPQAASRGIGCGRALALFAGTLVLGLIAIAGIGIASADAIATAIADEALRSRGYSCTPLAVDIDGGFQALSISATECTRETGPLASLSLPRGASVALSGTRAEHVRIPELELRQRESDPPDLSALADGGVPEPMQRALDGLATLAATDIPRIEVDELRSVRGERMVTSRELTLAHEGDALVLRIASAGGPPRRRQALEISGAMVGLEGRATPSEVELRGRMTVGVELGRLEIDRAIPFVLSGRALDSSDPRYAISFDRPDALGELRERLAARREERVERREERRDAREERRDERQERVEEVRERAVDARSERRDAFRERRSRRLEGR